MVAQTTYYKGVGLYKEKILEILRITHEDFDKEPIVYCVSAATLILFVVVIAPISSAFVCLSVVKKV